MVYCTTPITQAAQLSLLCAGLLRQVKHTLVTSLHTKRSLAIKGQTHSCQECVAWGHGEKAHSHLICVLTQKVMENA